jgi:hypothetical protein
MEYADIPQSFESAESVGFLKVPLPGAFDVKLLVEPRPGPQILVRVGVTVCTGFVAGIAFA